MVTRKGTKTIDTGDIKMELIIKSKKLNRSLIFYKKMNGETIKSYIFVNLNGNSGCLGKQLCEHGLLIGATIACTDRDFKKECRKWYRQFVKNVDAVRALYQKY